MNVRAKWACLFVLLTPAVALPVDCTIAKPDARFVVCRMDLRSERLRLFHADPQGRPYRSFEALRTSLAAAGMTLSFAMNAGMFHADHRPVGLLVIDGVTLAPINRGAGFGNFYLQPNGAFLVDGDGARVLPTHEYRGLEPSIATQSGPLLLSRGMIPDIPVFRAGSNSRRIRNGVCAPTPRSVAFVISNDPVTFFEFARFFRDSLGCQDALYLDGSISSLYAPQLDRVDDHAALGPMFAVTR